LGWDGSIGDAYMHFHVYIFTIKILTFCRSTFLTSTKHGCTQGPASRSRVFPYLDLTLLHTFVTFRKVWLPRGYAAENGFTLFVLISFVLPAFDENDVF
jgi:hypothetical protein